MRDIEGARLSNVCFHIGIAMPIDAVHNAHIWQEVKSMSWSRLVTIKGNTHTIQFALAIE
jgi:hypothetical protein